MTTHPNTRIAQKAPGFSDGQNRFAPNLGLNYFKTILARVSWAIAPSEAGV